MAVDTREKRASVIGFVWVPLPLADSAVGAADREQLSRLYAFLSTTATVPDVPGCITESAVAGSLVLSGAATSLASAGGAGSVTLTATEPC